MPLILGPKMPLVVGDSSAHCLMGNTLPVGGHSHWVVQGLFTLNVKQHRPDGGSYSMVAVTIESFQIVYIFRFLHVGERERNSGNPDESHCTLKKL